MQRDLSFDYMKGFLIFLVVLGHCPAILLMKEGFDVYSDYLFVFCYSFHMPLFVFISGYFFAKKRHCNWKELIPKQFKRLLLPQFSWNLVALVLILLMYDKFSYLLVGESTVQTIKCIYHFLTNQWYLWCIFICGIITVLAYKTKYPLIMLLGLSILMIVTFDYLPGVIFKNQQVAKQLLFFTGGVYLHDIKNHDKMMHRFFISSLVFYILCWIFYSLYGVAYGKLNMLPVVLWSIIGVVAFYNISKFGFFHGIFRSTLVIWGGDSLGIYIIHTIINKYFIQGVIGFHIDTGYLYIDYLLCFIYSIFLTWLCVLCVKVIRKNLLARTLFLGECK